MRPSSSCWVRSARGLPGVVEGYGPTRAAEILREVQRRSIAHWLALDDHPSVVDAAREDRHFIACSGRTGVASTDVQQALRQALEALQKGGASLHPQGRTGR
ncbi:HAD domain-containing protein [Paraburkholderia nodosa]|uniref:HAD domain-containing protein n=1 Tax=Paraburkholderia nodosa TaxID=392320 RepID=UPI00210E464C|nr:HAD domain-containing protein [Paraburkholderia nodosa]